MPSREKWSVPKDPYGGEIAKTMALPFPQIRVQPLERGGPKQVFLRCFGEIKRTGQTVFELFFFPVPLSVNAPQWQGDPIGWIVYYVGSVSLCPDWLKNEWGSQYHVNDTILVVVEDTIFTREASDSGYKTLIIPLTIQLATQDYGIVAPRPYQLSH